MRSFAYEARTMGRELGTDADKIDAEIERALDRHPDEVDSGKESAALFGGSLKKAMDQATKSTKRYAVFRWASMISHGLIVGLRELEKSLSGVNRDVFERAAHAPDTEAVLYTTIWPVLHLAGLLQEEFGVDVAVDFDQTIRDVERVNGRMRFVLQEQFVSGLTDIGVVRAHEQCRKQQ
jgi:hypothetical protein